MIDKTRAKTGLEEFDLAYADTRSEMSTALPDVASIAGISAAPVSAIAKLDRKLSERFPYPLLASQLKAIFEVGTKQLRIKERSLKRLRWWLAVQLWWQRNVWFFMAILLGLAVLAALGTAYYYRAEIQQWLISFLPNSPATPTAKVPANGAGVP